MAAATAAVVTGEAAVRFLAARHAVLVEGPATRDTRPPAEVALRVHEALLDMWAGVNWLPPSTLAKKAELTLSPIPPLPASRPPALRPRTSVSCRREIRRPSAGSRQCSVWW